MVDPSVIIVAFLTGLTTGGLSCLAVQGGLLTGSFANQVELSLRTQPAKGQRSRAAGSAQAAARAVPGKVARATVVFLAAKLITYTALGAMLGALGTLLQLTPTSRAILQTAIAVFLIGNALRMLEVHPMFRVFALEPPAAVRRAIRKLARTDNDSFHTPALLGALTVLIPCGVTQTMMVLAMGTGSAWAGASILFAFTLGSSPTFFALLYLAAHLGARLERRFTQAVAMVLLVLGLVSLDAGLNLLGAPSFSSGFRTLGRGQSVAAPAPTPSEAAGDPVITLYARNQGYEPAVLAAPADTPVALNVVTEDTWSCARAFVIPQLLLERLLPETGTVTIHLPARPAGSVIRFTCSMGMYSGVIEFN